MAKIKLTMPIPVEKIKTVDRIVTIDTMFDDLNWILQNQIEKQRIKAATATFDEKDMKSIEALTDSLVKLSREARERIKSDALQDALKDLSEEELQALEAKKSLK